MCNSNNVIYYKKLSKSLEELLSKNYFILCLGLNKLFCTSFLHCTQDFHLKKEYLPQQFFY